ncbi:hypothetical protein, partial [Salinimicrobium xinjiangense]|uniref:hypothetical protein n=1 Tax=Salinimicrobium xinjiangense TaxID=438596 RepID=UPI000569915A
LEVKKSYWLDTHSAAKWRFFFIIFGWLVTDIFNEGQNSRKFQRFKTYRNGKKRCATTINTNAANLSKIAFLSTFKNRT